MRFVVSSSDLLNHLASISRVISTKNTLPILNNFLFQLKDHELKITASDLETTFVTSLNIENVESEGEVAIPAKLLMDTLKEFSDQPLTFSVDDKLSIEISWNSGKSNIPGASVEDFPTIPALKEETKSTIEILAEVLNTSINNTIFATGNDELRPAMNGIYFDLNNPEGLTFVASDTHKLVRYIRHDIKPAEGQKSFILPQKPAGLLKTILPKEEGNVHIEFDDKNVLFTLANYVLVCRLIEGVYPAYNSVIPKENPNKVTVDRVEFLNSIRRVANFSSQAINLIKLKISSNEMVSYAQDLDFSISGHDRISCQYDGENMEIGFKSTYLIEILSNLTTQNICIELADANRAALFLPVLDEPDENENVLMLLMPMMIG